MIADYLAENNWIFVVGGFSALIGFAIAMWAKRQEASTKKEKESKKKKQKTEAKPDSSKKTK